MGITGIRNAGPWEDTWNRRMWVTDFLHFCIYIRGYVNERQQNVVMPIEDVTILGVGVYDRRGFVLICNEVKEIPVL